MSLACGFHSDMTTSGLKGRLKSMRETAADCTQILQISLSVGRALGVGDSQVEPGPGKRPDAVGSAAADPQGGGGLLMRQSGKKPQLDERGSLRVVLLQEAQGFVQGQQFRGALILN